MEEEKMVEQVGNVPLKKEIGQGRKTASIVLLIIGGIFTLLTLILASIYGAWLFPYLASADGAELGNAIGLMIYIAYFGVPSIILGPLSLLLNIIAISLYTKPKALKVTFLVLSILITIMAFLFFFLFYAV